MDTRGPDAPGGEPKGRGVDIVVWCIVIAAMVVLAAGIAIYLAGAKFTISEVTFDDEAADVTLIEPDAPPAVQPPPVAPPVAPPTPESTRGPNGEVLRRPVWVRQPQPDFPLSAMRHGVERGDVVLRCETLASGRFGACIIVSETPPGVGFAEAAAASLRQARVTPSSVDGFATDGEIQFTIRFRMAPEQ